MCTSITRQRCGVRQSGRVPPDDECPVHPGPRDAVRAPATDATAVEAPLEVRAQERPSSVIMRTRGRPQGWCHSSIRQVLFNELHRGVILWNRTKRRDVWGVKHQRSRSDAEWLRVEAPLLRVVDDRQWAAAHERLSVSRATYLRAIDGRLWCEPATGTESKYLLSGLAQCGCAGAASTSPIGALVNGRSFYDGCSSSAISDTFTFDRAPHA